MNRTFAVSAVLALGMVGSLAHADAPRATYRFTDPSRIGAQWTSPAPANVSHIIYMNNCKPNGCTLHAGNDNSTTDTSSIPNSTSVVSAYSGSDANWQSLVNCVKQSYAPFNVQIVTDRPAAGTNFHMAIVAGTPQNVGESNGVLGVSPFTCGYIPNSISFTFANLEPTNILDLCWTVSQETAHSWGLDHKFDDRDPMTYLQSGPSMKTFQNEQGSCGEYSARTCSCTYAQTGNQAMNSYQLIMATFGSSAPDTMPPTVSIDSPANGATVMPGFPIRATAMDNVAIDHVELRVDGQVTATASTAPYSWSGPAMLSMGNHHVEVTAYDLMNNATKAAVDVTYGKACMKDPDCGDPNQVCVDGRCVAGPGMMGGLGSTCTKNEDCADGQCASDGTHMYCTESCDPAKNACPSNFGCLAVGAGAGVCWPGADNGGGGGGGCDTSGSGGATILLGLGFAAVLITRRRK